MTTAERVKVGVIPAGAMGLAFAQLASERGHLVTVYFHHFESLDRFERTRKSERLKGKRFAEDICGTNDIREAVEGMDVVFMAPPSAKFEEVFEAVEPFFEDGQDIGIGSKGLIRGTNSTISQYILGRKPKMVDNLVVMHGPTLAREMVAHKETGIVFASYNEETAERLQALFYTDKFRVYTNADVVGVESGGALKNIMAFGAGAGAAMRISQNTMALYLTRSLAEMIRLGMALGAQDERTFSGLSGFGDLIVSSMGKGSRNKQAGRAFALGQSAESLLSSGTLVEGLHTVKVAAALANERGIDAPITKAIERALRGELKIHEGIQYLMSREPTKEYNGLRSLRFNLDRLRMTFWHRARATLSL